MRPAPSVVEIVAALWFLGWTGAAVALHFKLVETLRQSGRPVSWWLQNQWWVEGEYARMCEEQGVSPWPRLRPIIICGLVAVPAWIVLMVCIMRGP